MWHFGIQFSRHGGVGLTVGPDDLRGLFQPMILGFYEVCEQLSWGLGHQFPASLLRKSNGLKPDLPSLVAQAQVQPNWPGECRPVAGAIP